MSDLCGVIWCDLDAVYICILDNLLHDHIMQCENHGGVIWCDLDVVYVVVVDAL